MSFFEQPRRVIVISALYALVMTASYLLKPVRSALFLEHVGVAHLPAATAALAAATAIGGVASSLLAARLGAARLLWLSTLAIVPTLVAFRFALIAPQPALVFVFYLGVGLFGVIVTSLVWLVASSAFDAREARRHFGTIGLAGSLGAVVGGLLTRLLASGLGTPNLLVLCAVVLAPCLVLVPRATDEKATSKAKKRADPGGAFAGLGASRLLQLLAMSALIAAAVSVVVDIQFNDIVDRAFPDRDAKTAFFGTLLAALSAGGCLVQLLVTPRLLASRGVTAALLVLPALLALGSAALWLVPGLIAASAIKSADGVLRHSIHKSASEIVLVPIPELIKRRGKLVLDTTVGSLGEAAGALLTMLVTQVAGLPYRALSLVALALTAVWLWTTRLVGRGYVDAFRTALARREIDPDEIQFRLRQASTADELRGPLTSSNVRQISYALELAAAAPSAELAPQVLSLVDHESAEVRKRALPAITAMRVSLPPGRIDALLADPDADVRLEAARLLRAANVRDPEHVAELLGHDDVRVRAAALEQIARDGSRRERALVDELRVRAILAAAQGAVSIRAQVARAIGFLGDASLYGVLDELTLDRQPLVVTAAIEAAGQTLDPRFVPFLVGALGRAQTRQVARAALALAGAAALPALAEALRDPAHTLVLRAQVARTIGAIGHQDAVDVLQRELARRAEPALEGALVVGLGKLKAKHPSLGFDVAALEQIVLDKATRIAELQRDAAEIEGLEATARTKLLRRAVDERVRALIEQTLRLLGIVYGQRDMHRAFVGLASAERASKANALELIDNVVAPRLAKTLLPALEGHCDIPRMAPYSRGEAHDALRRLSRAPDPWLRACAAFAIAEANLHDGDALRTRAREDEDPIVREAAC